jgi:hypothetical protein
MSSSIVKVIKPTRARVQGLDRLLHIQHSDDRLMRGYAELFFSKLEDKNRGRTSATKSEEGVDHFPSD